MAFQGNKFIFDGVPGEAYGLMLANIDKSQQNAGVVGGTWKVQEDRIARRFVGLDYGVTAGDPLSFPIAMVAMDDNRYYDRYDVAAIAGWLTSHQSFKKLIILQEDMENVYYKCRITKLDSIEIGMHIVGFTATVTCDCPFAYLATAPWEQQSTSSGARFTYFNPSNVNDYFYPVLTLENVRGTSVRITNESDQQRSFVLSGLPSPSSGSGRTITIDCARQIMVASDGINLYQYWNRNYMPRAIRGNNTLYLKGNFGLTLNGDVMWNIGS